MKNLLVRNYHFVLLGAVVLIALGITAYLITQASGFDSAFAATAAASKKTGSPSLPASTNPALAIDHLQKPPLWKLREDGASPLVSRPYLLKEGKLIDPMTGSEPLYPPVPNQWLIDHQLDYTDVNILERDPNHKGFTILEEFLAGTDPNKPGQLPPLHSKLSYSDTDIRKSTYVLEFLGVETNEAGKAELQIRPALPLPNPAKGNRPDTSTRGVLLGDAIPGAPFLKTLEYNPKKKTINETEYDVSELVLQNTLTGEHHSLIQKNTSREYKKQPIELVESVTFHYQLAGAPMENITVERGKDLVLGSLDKKNTQTYKLVDFSKDGILLDLNGKHCTVKPSAASSTETNRPTPAPPQ
jgi:hypothetical protein